MHIHLLVRDEFVSGDILEAVCGAVGSDEASFCGWPERVTCLACLKIASQLAGVDRRDIALRLIRESGNNLTAITQWMQKLAAWALDEPGIWPFPGSEPETKNG